MSDSEKNDEASEQGPASPRTTIVGGQPPGKSAELPKIPGGIQRLLRLASVDEGFRRELIERRAGAARAAGVELRAAEAAILSAVPASQLEQMAEMMPPPQQPRREFLRQTAATAAVLLGGAAFAEATSACGPRGAPAGVQPDLPPDHIVPAGQQTDIPPEPEPDPDAGAPPNDRVRPNAGVRPEPMPPDAGVGPNEKVMPIGGVRPDTPPPNQRIRVNAGVSSSPPERDK